MLPEFDGNGNLPKGIHDGVWTEIVDRLGCNSHRSWLLTGLLNAPTNLREAGCRFVYIDGSFATSKKYPADFDVCWDIEGVV